MKQRVALYTLGCKLNFSETSTIGQLFQAQDFQIVELDQQPHVVVINTCSVTEHANQKCLRAIRDANRITPKPFIVVIGCYAQLKPEEISKASGVDLVLGTDEKFKIISFLHQVKKRTNPLSAAVRVSPVQDAMHFSPSYSIGDKTRTFLKIQDGCNYHCTYCTIPLARGRSRSASIEDILEQVKHIAQKNVKEIVLTGVNIGDFGIVYNKRRATFLELLKALNAIHTIERFRISSIEPNLLTKPMVDFIAANPKFMPHFHIPLQSGSDKILKLMQRRYTTALYQDRIAYIKSAMPSCAIGVDVIVGFPGESEEDFLQTYHFLNQLPIAYLHVFPYSERNNTKAAYMPESVPVKERQQRAKMLRILSAKKLRAFYQEHLGQSADVLFESTIDNNTIKGFTSNYIRVQHPYREDLIGQICSVVLDQINEHGLVTARIVGK